MVNNDNTPFEIYPLPTQDPMFNYYHSSDMNFEYQDDASFTSTSDALTPMSSISSPFSSPSIPDLDSLDLGLDDMYLAPPVPTSRSSRVRASPILSFSEFATDTDIEEVPPLLVFTSLDHAKRDFDYMLQASSSLIPTSHVRDRYEALEQLSKHQHLSSSLRHFRIAFKNYELFHSEFYTLSESDAATVLKINVLGFYISLAKGFDYGNGCEVFEEEFAEILGLCEELARRGVVAREWIERLRQVAVSCQDRVVKRRAVVLLSCYTREP